MVSILRQKPLGVLNWLTIAIGGVVFIPVYILAIASTLVPLTPMPSGVSGILSTLPFIPFYFVSIVFFGNATSYLLVSVASLILGIAALAWGHPGRWARISALIIILAVIAFPLWYRYTPPVSGAPGYSMQVVTQPNFFNGIVKMSQVVTEKRPCEYTLLGWSTNNHLYYQATCGKVELWRYDPLSNRNERMMAVPDDLSQVIISESSVVNMVRADGVRPKEYESTTRPLYVQSKGYVSPDQQWVAVVTRHIYGPEDIVVLTASE
jgi:hypothetical protein